MGLASGAVAFRRYRVHNNRFTTVDDAMVEALTANGFGRYGAAADDDVEVGWITPNHLFDTSFAGEKIACGRFVFCNMRMDRNSVPGSVLRSYVAMEEEAALEASGREFLGRKEKREAKEAARLRADKEARSGAFRRITSYPLLWDLDKQMLYFGNSANAANDKFMRLFCDTFEAVLEPVNAHHAAVAIAESAGRRREIEDARPAHLIPPPDDVDGDVYGLDPEDRSFFGREFLSWLWYATEQSEGTFDLLDKADVAASIARLIHLKCDFNLSGSAMLRADAPARALEGRAGLAAGKQPAKLGLLLAARSGEWSFVLDGVTLDVSGLTLPQTEEKDAIARLEERFESIAEAAGVMDALFAEFMRRRLSGDWDALLKNMCKWATGGRGEQGAARPRLVSA